MVTRRHDNSVSLYVTKNFSRLDLSLKCMDRFNIHLFSSSSRIWVSYADVVTDRASAAEGSLEGNWTVDGAVSSAAAEST